MKQERIHPDELDAPVACIRAFNGHHGGILLLEMLADIDSLWPIPMDIAGSIIGFPPDVRFLLPDEDTARGWIERWERLR